MRFKKYGWWIVYIFLIGLTALFFLAGLPKHQLFGLQSQMQSVFQFQSLIDLRAQEGLTTLVEGTLPPDTSCSGTQFYCSGKTTVYKGTKKLVNGKCTTQTSYYKECDTGRTCNSATVNNGGVCTGINKEIIQNPSSAPLSPSPSSQISSAPLSPSPSSQILIDNSQVVIPTQPIPTEELIQPSPGVFIEPLQSVELKSTISERVGFFSKLSNSAKDGISKITYLSSNIKKSKIVDFNLNPAYFENFRSNAEICNTAGLIYAPFQDNICIPESQCSHNKFKFIVSYDVETLKSIFEEKPYQIIEGICVPFSDLLQDFNVTLKSNTLENVDYNSDICFNAEKLFNVDIGKCMTSITGICDQLQDNTCAIKRDYFKEGGLNILPCNTPGVEESYPGWPNSSIMSSSIKLVRIPLYLAAKYKSQIYKCTCNFGGIAVPFEYLYEQGCPNPEEKLLIDINTIPEQHNRKNNFCEPFMVNGDSIDKYDLVFMGVDYKNIEDFKKDIKKNLFDDESSFFNMPPGNRLKDKFNIWYSPVIIDSKASKDNDIANNPDFLRISDDCVYESRFILTPITAPFFTSGVGEYDRSARIGFAFSAPWFGELLGQSTPVIVTHELGHGIGEFDDEYTSGKYGTPFFGRSFTDAPFSVESLNCDVSPSCTKFGSFVEECSKGCTFYNLYRSSSLSIMNGGVLTGRLLPASKKFSKWQEHVIEIRVNNLWR